MLFRLLRIFKPKNTLGLQWVKDGDGKLLNESLEIKERQKEYFCEILECKEDDPEIKISMETTRQSSSIEANVKEGKLLRKRLMAH